MVAQIEFVDDYCLIDFGPSLTMEIFLEAQGRVFGAPQSTELRSIMVDFTNTSMFEMSEEDWMALGAVENAAGQIAPYEVLYVAVDDTDKRARIDKYYVSSKTRHQAEVVFVSNIVEAIGLWKKR